MTDINYHELQAELDTILQSFNDGEVDIESALKSYERATAIIGQLEEYLESAENTIRKIKSTIQAE